MYQFKVIALVPFEGTDMEFSKNLKLGQAYQFYQGYAINNSHGEITSVYKEAERQAVESLYTLKNGLQLSFSAVVGGNGSGKSALFELLYYIIYKISVTGKLQGGMASLEYAEVDLRRQRQHVLRSRVTFAELLGIEIEEHSYDDSGKIIIEPYKLDDRQKIKGVYQAKLIREFNIEADISKIRKPEDLDKEILKGLLHKADRIEAEMKKAMEKEQLLNSRFNASLIYETSSGIFEVNCQSDNIRHFTFEGSGKQPVSFGFENFFYTISLNYSHHGLNSKTLGQWITKLFHKNDAYNTPVVISPMRTDGNYDINNELKLSRERLMNSLAYNLVKDRNYDLLDKYTLSEIIFKPKRNPYPLPYGNPDFDGLRSAAILKGFNVKAFEGDMPYVAEAVAYLEEKMFKIGVHYSDLIAQYYGEGKTHEQALVSFILEENTHATKKIRQTLNYLNIVTNRLLKTPLPLQNVNGEMIMHARDLKSYVKNYIEDVANASSIDIAEAALPGFVSVDFEFQSAGSDGLRLSKLSSGEQQMIFNIDTIMYHIYNLASVHRGKSSSSQTYQRPSYGNINIVLDEIELYYHPEMQREVIKNLVDSFQRMADPSQLGIHSINVCILTHSPFILSDIPLQNTLRLKQGEPQKSAEQTFGANIHELLYNDFFLKSFMGEFARQKIQDIIGKMQRIIEIKTFNRANPDRAIPIASNTIHDREQCKRIIDLAGEPVLYVSLMEMYEEAFTEADDYIVQRLELLKQKRK